MSCRWVYLNGSRNCPSITRHGTNEPGKPPKRKVATSTYGKICFETKEEVLAEFGAIEMNHCGNCDP